MVSSPGGHSRIGAGAGRNDWGDCPLDSDHQIFEIYRETTSTGLWMLDVVQD
jgi:hypothetical protein